MYPPKVDLKVRKEKLLKMKQAIIDDSKKQLEKINIEITIINKLKELYHLESLDSNIK